jgi:hypothetical protein
MMMPGKNTFIKSKIYFMKKIPVILCLLLSLGCKKNKDHVPGEIVLGKRFMNNILIRERIFSGDGKLVREQNYNEKTGLFSDAVEFEYNTNGQLVREKQFGSGNKLSAIVSYEWKPNGRLEKHEYLVMSGTDSGKSTIRVRYGYDLKGRIAEQSWVDIFTDKVYDARYMSYYGNNNLKSVKGYNYYGGPAELKYLIEYSPVGNTLLPGHASHTGYIIDFRLPEFVAAEKNYYYYNGALITIEIKTSFSNRQYNDRGYLISQTETNEQPRSRASRYLVKEFFFLSQQPPRSKAVRNSFD